METDLASTLHELRLELKLLRRKQCRLARLQNPGMTHPMQRMLLCTLIACLCNDDALARMWAVMDRRRLGRARNSKYAEATLGDGKRWRLQYATDGRILVARQDLEHSLRREADDFLMESLTVEAIEKQCRQGIMVPGTWVLETYIRLWRQRPRCKSTDQLLVRLETENGFKRKWAWNFRRRWRLRCGALRGVRSLPATV